jgi:ribosomal protein S1
MSEKNNQPEFDIFSDHGKYNESIKLTEEDKNSGIKIYCKEPYAQDLYDAMRKYEAENNVPSHVNKDLNVGQIYQVSAVKISFTDKLIYAEEEMSKVEIEIPFKEYSKSVDSLSRGEDLKFNVMIIKGSGSNYYVGSEKKCKSLNCKQELFDHLENKEWFEVKVERLIKGGYIATYKDSVECFIPGSHAAANVIRDFKKLLGKTMNIMIDNYDQANDLFILSYKKYIQHSMPQMISNLRFGHRYTGTLTNYPYDFGVFVEFEDYFTGLIHSSEFENYEEERKKMSPGDSIEFYVKNVTKKGKQYRTVLTLNETDVDSEKRRWTDLKEKTENKSFEYEVDSKSNSIKIQIEDEMFEVTLRRRDLEKNLSMYPKVRVYKVDPINKNLKFEFISSE